jgi:hypothetical protein
VVNKNTRASAPSSRNILYIICQPIKSDCSNPLRHNNVRLQHGRSCYMYSVPVVAANGALSRGKLKPCFAVVTSPGMQSVPPQIS